MSRFSAPSLMSGGTRFCFGFAKASLLASPMGHMADAAFAAGAGSLGTFSAWMGVIAFAFQIYFLFSACVDMAAGVALALGFELGECFDSPLKSEGIADFWRRWCFVPGGNGAEKVRALRAMVLTLVIGVLWIGPSWGLVVWGVIHSCLLALDHRMGAARFYASWPKPLKIAITFFMLLMSWVFFRAETIGAATGYLAIMFGLGPKLAATAPLLDADMLRNFNAVLLLVCALVLWVLPSIRTLLRKPARWKMFLGLCLFALALAMMLTRGRGSFLSPVRQHTQSLLTRLGGEGNRAVHIGNREWLYSRPEIAALHGRGPLMSAIASSAVRQGRKGTREGVFDLAAHLKERGVPLMLVPVPVKPMIYPEFLSSQKFDAPVYHRDQLALYEQLRAAGIDVIDLAPEMWRLKLRKQVFLQQDTHWTPDAMKVMAEIIAKHIRTKYPQALRPLEETPIVDARILDRSSRGDLVGRLDVASPASLFGQEEVTLVSIVGMDPSADSAISVMGDSFVSVFDDPALGFAPGSESGVPRPLKAGFGNQLAVLLNQPLDVMARSTGGSLAVMREFATQTEEQLAKKKLVIWVLAADDLISSR